jgi:cytochrome d ubiquinol oxidase subunit II
VEPFWIALLGLLTAGYFALAGFDYGTSLLFRFTGRDEAERRRVLGAMTPFVLGNEVWLVAAVGVLFGAFPRLEGELLSGEHTVFTAILVGLVLFTASVQLRGTNPAWDVPLITGALVVSIGWGVLAADLTGSSPVVWGAGMVALFALHGATFLAWRLPGPLGLRARRLASSLLLPSAVFVVAAAVLSADVVLLVVLVPLLGAWRTRQRLAFACTAVACALPIPLVFAAETIVTPAVMSHSPTLELLTWVAIPVLPLVVLFQWVTWWIFRGQVRHATG